jgi:hybrid cluster-associated redox disulfide protein
MSFRVTGETIIGDILDANADSAPFFLEMGMHCLGCPSARGESLAEACEVHGVDASAMTSKLNAFFEGARTA